MNRETRVHFPSSANTEAVRWLHRHRPALAGRTYISGVEASEMTDRLVEPSERDVWRIGRLAITYALRRRAALLPSILAGVPQDRAARCTFCSCTVPLDHPVGGSECESFRIERLASITADKD